MRDRGAGEPASLWSLARTTGPGRHTTSTRTAYGRPVVHEYTAGPLVHKYEDGRRDGVRLAVIHEEDGPFVREYEDGTAYGWPSYARRTVRRTAGRRT